MADEGADDGSSLPSAKSMLHGRIIQSQSREIVANVFAFMKREAEFGQQIPLRCVTKRVIAATGVSERSIRRIQREAELVYSGGAASFASPRTKKKKTLKVKARESLPQDSSDACGLKQKTKTENKKSKKKANKMLYPSLEDMKVDQLARAQRPYEAAAQAYGASSNAAPYPYPGSASTYPTLGSQAQSQHPNIVSSAPPPPPYSLNPSAPSPLNAPNHTHQGPVPRQYHSAIYPSLNDYMGLELTPETIAQNMPEYQTPAILAATHLQPVNSSMVATVGGMVAPLSGQSLGLQRAQVTHGIRELTLCKDAQGKIGLRVQAVNNGVFVCVVVKGSPAALAGLRFGDQILQINGDIVAGYTMDQVHKLFRESPINGISVVVRDRPFERTVTLHKDSTGHVGFHFKEGKIVGLVQDSSAARNGLLTDHHVLEVNGQNVVGVPDKDITAVINEGGPTITITIIPSFVFDHMVKKMSSNLLKSAMDHSIPNV